MFISLFFFFFNDTATTEIYTLSLHDALPISTSSPSRNTIDRKPSHFGSKDSEPSGICGTDFASIGATGGMTGSSMRSLLRTVAVRDSVAASTGSHNALRGLAARYACQRWLGD